MSSDATRTTLGADEVDHRGARLGPSTRALARERFEQAIASAWLPWTIVGFGIVLRLGRFLADRSLWLDESFLALNLLDRSYGELFETLDFNQGAPYGFLFAEKAAITLFGDGERSLHLLPLLASVCGLFLFFALARRLLAGAAVVPALLLFATMEPFLSYAAQAKQYGVDVAVTLALVYLFARTVERAGWSTQRTVLLAMAGAAALWLSHPAVFVLAGIGTASLFMALLRRDLRGLASAAVAGTAWLASFALEYVVALEDLKALRATLSGGGSAGGDAIVETEATAVKALYVIFNQPGGLPRTAVALAFVLSGVGLATLWRRRPAAALAVLATGVWTFVALVLERYPIGARFILFLLPLAILLLVEGTTELLARVGDAPRVALALGIGALIFVPPAARAAKGLVRPPATEEIKPLLTHVAESWRSGDVLYVHYGAAYAFRYYLSCDDCDAPSRARTLWPFEPQEGTFQWTPPALSSTPALVIGRHGPAAEQLTLDADLAPLRGKPRVWLLFTHYYPETKADILDALRAAGRERACTERGVAFACLYDFTR